MTPPSALRPDDLRPDSQTASDLRPDGQTASDLRPDGQTASDRYAEAARYRFAPGWPAGGSAAGYPADHLGGRPAPTPVLMLHGLGGDSGQRWRYAGGDPWRSRLAPDPPAHGATMLVGERESFIFAGLTRDLMALLDRLRFPPAVVVGMSMGAGVAVCLARRQPGRVRGLVLIRPAWLDVAPAPNLLPLMLAGRLLQRHGAEAGRARFLESGRYADVLERSPAAAASRPPPGGSTAARRRPGWIPCLPHRGQRRVRRGAGR